jgi:hypothetical protein
METFEQKYCVVNQCSNEQFRRRVFWKCLHRHAIPAVPFMELFDYKYFEADREFIAAVGAACNMTQVWAEVREYFLSPNNRGWLRRNANMRISARRLLTLAGKYLGPQAEVFPPSEIVS